jgi:hypothetical protein
VVGDVDCNGRADGVDATLILQRHARLLRALPCEDSADVNDDGAVDSKDALLVLQIDAGLLPGSPV